MIDGPEKRRPPTTASSSSYRAIRATASGLSTPEAQEERFRTLLREDPEFWVSLRDVFANTIPDEALVDAALFGAMIAHLARKREEEICLISDVAGRESGQAAIEALVPRNDLRELHSIATAITVFGSTTQ